MESNIKNIITTAAELVCQNLSTQVEYNEILGSKRDEKYVLIRQMVIALLRQRNVIKYKYKELSKIFGGRHHTTLMNNMSEHVSMYRSDYHKLTWKVSYKSMYDHFDQLVSESVLKTKKGDLIEPEKLNEELSAVTQRLLHAKDKMMKAQHQYDICVHKYNQTIKRIKKQLTRKKKEP